MPLSKNYELGTLANTLDIDQSTGEITSLNIDTDVVSEGANLYFTSERVDDRVAALIQAGTNITVAYDDVLGTLTISASDTEDDLSNNTTSDLAEGTNLYYTDARADARIAAATTTDLTEGTNLYYTDARADARAQLKIDALVDSAPNTLDTLNELASALGDDANFSTTITNSIATKLATADFDSTFDTRLGTKSTTNLTEGTNLYYTDARADARIALQAGANLDLSSKSTSDLTEGTNLYYTNARVDAHLNQSNPTSGYVLSWNGSDYAWIDNTGYTAFNTDFDTRLGTKTTANLTEGSNQYYTTARANTAIDARVTKTFVDNLNVDADTLGGEAGSYYLNYNNFTNTPSIPATGVDFDPVGTDNSTDVTLAGSYDYLTISGQEITLGQIDASTDITGLATVATTGAYSDLTGTPTIPTNNNQLTNGAGYATESYVDSNISVAIDDLVGGAPGALDTLNELAAAINDDSAFSSTVTVALGNRLRVDINNQNLTGTQKTNAATNLGLATVATSGSYDDLSNTPTIPTNNNQLTNGAGYTTNVGDITGVTAGSGITGGGTSGTVTINHADTSSQASVNNSNGTVIQDITLDTYGHITGVASTNLDGRYYTETEADSRFVNVTGDTMTGDLTIANNDPVLSINDTNNGSGGGFIGHIAFNNTSGESFRIGDWAATNETGGPDILRLRNSNGTRTVFEWGQAGTTAGSLYAYNQRVFADDYHPNADKWTTARTLSLSGDASGSVSWDGSANATLSVTVANNSHTHVFGNITSTSLSSSNDLNSYTTRTLAHWGSSNPSNSPAAYGAMLVIPDGSQSQQLVQAYGGASNKVSLYGRRKTSGVWDTSWTQYFSDHYHPNADKWTTARTLSLSGDASGSVSWDGSANATLSVTVANDSHTHDGRYYTETEADSRFVNVTGDTMSGTLSVQTLSVASNSVSNTSDIALTANSAINAENSMNFGLTNNSTSYYSWRFGNTSRTSGTGGGTEKMKLSSAGVLTINGNTAFHDGYHPNADKWTTARTLSLSGDASGSVSWDGSANATLSVTVANNSHTHNSVIAVDDRDMKPSSSGIVTIKAMRPFFSSFGGMTGSDNTTYLDVLALDTYSDASGGGPSAITFHKGNSVGDPKMYIWKGAFDGNTWGTGQRVFADNYHPNADKWTTARTLSLSGDASGSVSWDGSANATLSVNVAANSIGITELNVTDGTSGQVLTTNGSGTLSFADASGGGGEFTLTVTGELNGTIHSSEAGNGGTGTHNFFAGTWAGLDNTTGSRNNFIGCIAGANNTTGSYNNFFGARAGFCNTVGSNNNFFGFCGGYKSNGNHNNFFGACAGKCNTFGSCNNFLGFEAGFCNTGGMHNNFLGNNAGHNNTTGACNNFFGQCAGYVNTTACFNNFFGFLAGKFNLTGRDNNFFGNEAGYCSSTGNRNNFFGQCAGWKNSSGGENNFIGPWTGYCNRTGSNNNFFGNRAGCRNDSGSCNNFIGYFAGCKNTSGYNNNFFGEKAGCDNTNGTYNNFIGWKAGLRNTSGDYNTYIGPEAGLQNTTGNYNAAIGCGSGYGNTTGSYNSFFGGGAGSGHTTGNYNVYVGDIGTSVFGTCSNYTHFGDGEGNHRGMFDNNGDFHSNGDVIAYSTSISDERLKKDISTVTNALSKIRQINGVEFTMKDDESRMAGVIAQEVEKVFPVAVTEKKLMSNETYKTVRYDAIHALLIEAVKELAIAVETLSENK